MTTRTTDNSVPAVLRRRYVSLRKDDGYNEEFCRALTHAADEIDRLRALNAELVEEATRRADECRALRKQGGTLAVLLLQDDREEVMQWARSVKITFPDGEPELAGAQVKKGERT